MALNCIINVPLLQLIFSVVTTPPEGPACPGEDVILTCSIQSIPQPMSVPPTMYWQQDSQTVYYYNGAPLSATFGDFDTTAYFSNNNYNIISNATLSDVMFTHNSITVTCSSPLYWVNEVISVAGAIDPPSEITIITTNNMSAAVLSWLPPFNEADCIFNYTVNITNSSSVTKQVCSNSTSLILTDLTGGVKYSFAVAVTDSTGQYGPWSEELKVIWLGDYEMSSSKNNIHVITSADTILPFKTVDSTMKESSTTISKREGHEFTFIYQLVIGLTSGILSICTATLVVAVCMIWWLRRQSAKAKKNDGDVDENKEESSAALDIPLYDVPIFTSDWEDINVSQNNMANDEMTLHQNIAYEQVYTHNTNT